MNHPVPCSTEQLIHSAEQLLRVRKLSEALIEFERARAQGADADRCSAGVWMTQMLLGDLEQAWRESDAIRRRGAPDPHRFWLGETIRNRRVILRCLHGFGDAVQFMRFAPRLRETASALIVEVPPKLLQLARYFEGVNEVITWGEQAPSTDPVWDVQIEVMELPHLFRTTCDDLPVATNYLKWPQGMREPRQTDVLQVGLVWTAGEWNPVRSLPLHMLETLLGTEHCAFWDLQPASEQLQEHAHLRAHMHVDEASQNSLERLATRISQLDLVITVDSLAAHLAGALGTPAWVMLPHEADWRWMHERVDSPWYPSLKLFRQPSAGDWPSVVAAIQQALAGRLQAAGVQKQVD